jgi:DNA-binding winged helix-turn-helix (wHTH) protein
MANIYSFGPFRLDGESEILFRGTEPTPAGQRAVALLRVLVEQPGMPISKDTLLEAAWPGLVVEESNLPVQIAALRKVLGQESGGEGWIETLSRRGYRFVGPTPTRAEKNGRLPQAALLDVRDEGTLPLERGYPLGDTSQHHLRDPDHRQTKETVNGGPSRPHRELAVIERRRVVLFHDVEPAMHEVPLADRTRVLVLLSERNLPLDPFAALERQPAVHQVPANRKEHLVSDIEIFGVL